MIVYPFFVGRYECRLSRTKNSTYEIECILGVTPDNYNYHNYFKNTF